MNKNLKNQINTNIFEYIKHKQKESSLADVATALINDFVLYKGDNNKSIRLFEELLYGIGIPEYAFEQYNLLCDIEKDIPDLTFSSFNFIEIGEIILANLYCSYQEYKCRNFDNIYFLFKLSINRLCHNCPMLFKYKQILFDYANKLLKDENVFIKQTLYDCIHTVVLNTLIKIQEKEKEIK